jgi:hypothetical protein
MMLAATRFLQLMIGAFVVGSMFAVWAGYDPRGYSYATYVEQHHNVVRGLNVLIPALAAFTIVLTLFAAWQQRAWRSQLLLLVDTWTTANPPAGWEVLRADWWTFHLMRMCLGTIGYALIVWSVVRPQGVKL